MKTRVELLSLSAQTEQGIKIGDHGYIDGYVSDASGVRAVVAFGEKLCLIPIHDLKIIRW